MELKKSRAVQQQDVWTAADALIAEGLRPTIERVRHKIGRGSPNTVSPMLDAWFASLGARLNEGLAPSNASNVPDLISRAIADIWQTALSTAQEDVNQSVSEERRILEQRRAELLLIQINLEQQQQQYLLREAAINETLILAKDQLALSVEQVQHLQALLLQRDKTLEENQKGFEKLAAQREAERIRNEEQSKLHVQSIVRVEERATVTERRLLLDIDRLRQEIKHTQIGKLEVERRFTNERVEWERSMDKLDQKTRCVDLEVVTLREKLSAFEIRTADLQLLLQAQTITTQAVMASVGRRSSKPGPQRRVSYLRK